MGRPTTTEIREAEEDASEAVKAALLISGADKTRFGRLKDELANNYLLGTDQYPATYEKAMRIVEIIRPRRQTGHSKETAPKAVSRSSSEEGEDADAGVAGAEQDVAAQQGTEQTPAEEQMPVPP